MKAPLTNQLNLIKFYVSLREGKDFQKKGAIMVQILAAMLKQSPEMTQNSAETPMGKPELVLGSVASRRNFNQNFGTFDGSTGDTPRIKVTASDTLGF